MQIKSLNIIRLGLTRGVPAGDRELALWNHFPTLGQPAYTLTAFYKN